MTNIKRRLTKERIKLSKSVSSFINAKTIRDLAINAPAGIGKTSTVVKTLVDLNERVRLTVQSNDMVMKQAEHLTKQFKINCQTITSFEYNVYQKHEITVPKKEKSHPWDHGKIVDDKAVTKIFNRKYPDLSNEKIEELINECKSETPDYENYDVVVMTHFRPLLIQMQEQTERMEQILELKSFTEKVDLDKIITVVDDPSFDSICKFKVADAAKKYVGSKVMGQEIKLIPSKHKKNVFLYVKTDNMVINHGTSAKTIWMSAEKVIIDMIVKNKNKKFYRVHTADLSEMDFGESNNVTLIGTNMVRAKHHAVIGMLIERTNRLVLRHKAKEPVYIADGLGLFNNTVNIRGRNDFIGESIIYKCSRPHGKVIEAAQHHLGDVSYGDVCKQLMLDTYIQVCGRTKGIRGEIATGKKAQRTQMIVMVEHQFVDFFEKNSPYKINSVIDLEINPTSRRMPEEKTYLNVLCWLITNNYDYFTNNLLGLSSGGDAKNRVDNDFFKELINMKTFDVPKVVDLINVHLNIRLEELKSSELPKDVKERKAIHEKVTFFAKFGEKGSEKLKEIKRAA